MGKGTGRSVICCVINFQLEVVVINELEVFWPNAGKVNMLYTFMKNKPGKIEHYYMSGGGIIRWLWLLF